MLTDDDIERFKLFGFIVMKNVLSPEEIKTIQAEFDHRADVASQYERFDGSKRHTFQMMDKDTPFYASLMEDPRILGPAEQIYGDVLGFNADGNRYVSDSEWHYDAGGFEAYGIKYAIYLQPMRAYNGALRVIPGSHKRPFHDELRTMEGIGERFSRGAATPDERRRAMEAINTSPSYVCDSDPGDAVAFDLRMFHSSYGGSKDRHMCSITYYNYPRTTAEIELTIPQARGAMATDRDNSEDPWNPPRYPAYWTENLDGHPKRKLWLEQFKELSHMKVEQNGLKAVVENGKLHVVPLCDPRPAFSSHP